MTGDLVLRRATRKARCHTALLVCWAVMAVLGGQADAAAQVRSAGLGISHPVHDTRPYAMIGAIVRGAIPAGHHFCTGSVVDSPAGDLVVTAAHCVDGGTGGLRFAPGYHDGRTPYGVWSLRGKTVAAGWTDGRNEDLDVAFLHVEPRHGRRIQDVVGGYALGVDESTAALVRITGYPDAADAPITCADHITAYGGSQLRIYCTDYTDGTSGSPWVVAGRTVMGVIGGFQQGGDTADVSYSPCFGAAVDALYRKAVAADP